MTFLCCFIILLTFSIRVERVRDNPAFQVLQSLVHSAFIKSLTRATKSTLSSVILDAVPTVFHSNLANDDFRL
jgi:hypothetical protein